MTRVLAEVRGPNRQDAFDRLVSLVYSELSAIAQARLRYERPDHTLEAPALVHEAYLRLLGSEGAAWNDRQHFFRAAAEAMRRVLIDHARRRVRAKRGGKQAQVSLDAISPQVDKDPEQFLALDDAIRRLTIQDPTAARVVELRYFVGLSVEETARTLEISERTVKREWAAARAWLYDALRSRGPNDGG